MGLEECQQTGNNVVVVLGHPDFYHRFGFTTAALSQISCEYEVPDEAFMLLELREGALAGNSGMVKYLPEFQEV
jgi:putative acetyltransferase